MIGSCVIFLYPSMTTYVNMCRTLCNEQHYFFVEYNTITWMNDHHYRKSIFIMQAQPLTFVFTRSQSNTILFYVSPVPCSAQAAVIFITASRAILTVSIITCTAEVNNNNNRSLLWSPSIVGLHIGAACSSAASSQQQREQPRGTFQDKPRGYCCSCTSSSSNKSSHNQ
jgi:hypothetical protein